MKTSKPSFWIESTSQKPFALHYLRLLVIGITVLFALLFLLPGSLHALICERLPFGPCPNSPFLRILDFWIDHREIWIVAAPVYALAVGVLFGSEVRKGIRKTTTARIGARLLLLVPALFLGFYAIQVLR